MKQKEYKYDNKYFLYSVLNFRISEINRIDGIICDDEVFPYWRVSMVLHSNINGISSLFGDCRQSSVGNICW